MIEPVRQQLNTQQSKKDGLEKDIFLEKEKMEKLSTEEARLNRYFDANNVSHIEKRNELAQKKLTAEGAITALEANLTETLQDWNLAMENFIPFTDPRETITQLNDKTPILLLPLRIETRFKKVEKEEGTIDELWVRVFPDDCSIDTFEEALSDAEILSANDFWVSWWKAAGQDSGRRGAWRSLVAGHGAGRSQYIHKTYEPINPDDAPAFDEENELDQVFLVLSKASEFTIDEKATLGTYWEAVWRANGDAAEIENAWNAIVVELGEEAAKEQIESHIPSGFESVESGTVDRVTALLSISFLQFPAEDEIDVQQLTWSHPPTVRMMPEKLVLLGYKGEILEINELGKNIPFPLIVGPDPKANFEDQMQQVDGEIQVSAGMKWMVDFEEAILKGMAWKIQLTEDQIQEGFTKLMVVGLQMSADEKKGKEEFQDLLHHHYFGNSGFSFLPVGTPTNNTEETSSGHTESEDADDSYNLVFNKEEIETDEETAFWWTKSDREWFIEMLGLSPDVFDQMINTDGTDQLEARAMNTALWPATWGYFFDSMMQPVFSESEVELLREYFNRYVIGRGTIPSIRIDNQPYGILPVTAFSRANWILDVKRPTYPYNADVSQELPRFLPSIYSLLKRVQVDWTSFLEDVAHVGKDGDPHQLLLDVLGLHGGSVEFHQRYGESLNHIFNLYQMQNTAGAAGSTGTNQVTNMQLWQALVQDHLGPELLTQFGYKGEMPEILEKLYVLTANKLDGDLIDDQELSETEPIRSYTEDDPAKNYIEWLISAASTSLDTLRKEEGFLDNEKPDALLYIMLKHSMELGYWHAGLQLHKVNEVLTPDELKIAKQEPDFIHISNVEAAAQESPIQSLSNKTLNYPFASESKYNPLYQTQAQITSDPTMLVADYIPTVLKTSFATQYLWDQVKALNHLSSVPTARLERAFVEHLDCASYRLDAWKMGLINYQLEAMRNTPSDVDDVAVAEVELENEGKGLFIGAYGWVENVKSENKTLTPIELENGMEEVFVSTSENPIVEDDKNGGFIHAPSLNHAVTGAILRNGYIANAEEGNPDAFAINLSSNRVRIGLSLLEGIRGGQSLSALLGYQFERSIHDRNNESDVDQYIYSLRSRFPLVANQLESTKETDEDVSIESIEARNVIDGISLIESVEKHYEEGGTGDYWVEIGLADIPSGDKTIVAEEIERIRDINDAVGDLGMAESVHQIVQGNIDRAAGTLDTYSKGKAPQVPEVVQTPRSGVNLTHRVGIQINPNADATVAGLTPRAQAEPGINEFLTSVLPDMENIIFGVSFYHADTDSEIVDFTISMEDLKVKAIDLLYILNVDGGETMRNLEELIIHYVRTTYPNAGAPNPPRLDADISISYYHQLDGKASVFEISPLLKSLRELLLNSRELRATDIGLTNEANTANDTTVSLDKSRLELVETHLVAQKGLLDTFVTTLETQLNAEPVDEAIVSANIDTWTTSLISIKKEVGRTGFPESAIQFAHVWRKQQLSQLIEKFSATTSRWENRITEYEDLLTGYAALVTDTEKHNLVRQLEKLVSAEPEVSPDVDPDLFRDAVAVKKTTFEGQLALRTNFVLANHQGISSALTSANALLDHSAYDLTPTDISTIETAVESFASELLTKAQQLQSELTTRLDSITELFVSHASESNANTQVELLREVAKTLFGEHFKLIPSFSFPTENVAEWKQALDNEEALLSYQKEVLENPLPVDDWLYGVARVREKMGSMEMFVQLAEGFKTQALELTPAQFPYRDPYSWFALEFGAETEEEQTNLKTVFEESDHLLYTAYYQHAFNSTEAQCGLLVDEWTEVIPTEKETSGIAFHYDRPNSEPPQTMLLVTPPEFTGSWQWQDVVDALHETLQEAKLRAVEPAQIESTGYGNYLPATISPVTKHPISIMMNYAWNNLSVNSPKTEDDA